MESFEKLEGFEVESMDRTRVVRILIKHFSMIYL